ncbi:MAG: Holliday junction branch migration DNA helicase RuvB [Cytophagales bacterium]|nr:Holliday junction branch migration DNA helicase RuvB [Cytophagales bacterium]
MREDYLRSHEVSSGDQEIDLILRPRSFADFHGQDKLKENLSVFVLAARQRNESMDHVLLHGPPGLGKTTFSHIVAAELDVDIKVTSGPILDKPADLAGLLSNLEARDVLFIDEIHRLNSTVEEYLYSAMEDFVIDILLDSGANAKSVRISISPFTLIGATTRSGLLTSPLRNRFGITSRLEYYTSDQLTQIVLRAAKLLKVSIHRDAAREIARRSRGTPRIAGNLLRRTRDFAQVKGKGIIDREMSEHSLAALEVDKSGLDEMDNRILRSIILKFSGGPVGLSTIATACSEEADTVEEVYEPFLIQEGYLERTPRGRKATSKAYQHLKIPQDGGKDGLSSSSLFDPLDR